MLAAACLVLTSGLLFLPPALQTPQRATPADVPQTAPHPGEPHLQESLDQPDERWHAVEPVPDGVRGGAARFDGRGSWLDVGPCALTSADAFTLRCSIRTNAAGFCTPLMARDGEQVALSLVQGRSNGCISFEAWSWQSVRLVSTQRIDDGQWHNIEVPYDPVSNTAMLFVD